MLISYHLGQTSVVLRIKIRDATTGQGVTALTSSSTGLRIAVIADNEATTTAYTSSDSTIESITTLGTYAAPTATKCRFKEVDSTNHKGVYEIQLADARFGVTSSKSVLISVSGVSGMAECDAIIPLWSVDPYSTKFGIISLPSVAPATSTGLPTCDSSNGVRIQVGTGTSQISVSGGIVKTDLAKILGTAITETTAGNLAAALTKFLDVATPVFTAAAVNQTGDSYARIGSAGSGLTALPAVTLPAAPTDWITAASVKADAVTKIQSGLATPTNITAGTITTVTNLTNAPTAGDLTAAMKASVTTAATAATPTAAAVTSAVTVDMTQSVPNDASDQTVGKALNAAIVNVHGGRSITDTTETYKNTDATTAQTHNLTVTDGKVTARTPA